MYIHASSSTTLHQDFRAIDIREDGDVELVETKSGPRSVQSADVDRDLFLSASGSNRDDAGAALGEVIFHLSNGRSRLGTERQHQAPPVIGKLSDMHEDLLDMIAGFVPHEDIASLAMVCKTWHDILNRPRRNRLIRESPPVFGAHLVQPQWETIDRLLCDRFEMLPRTAVARLHAQVSSINALESAHAAAQAELGDRDRKASTGNASLPVLYARGAAGLGSIAAIAVMGFAGGVPGFYANWLKASMAICFPQFTTIFPASELGPDQTVYEPYQTALGIATGLTNAIAAVRIGQIASNSAHSNDADFYGSLALLGGSLLSGLTHVRVAYHGVRARQARSAFQSTAQRLEERRTLVRAEVGPFPVAPDLSARVSKVDSRIRIRIEATTPIPPQAGAEPAL